MSAMKKPNTKNQAIRRSWAYRNRNMNPGTMEAAWRNLPKGVVSSVVANEKYLDRLKVVYFGDGSSLHFAYIEDNYVRTVKTVFNGDPIEQRLEYKNHGTHSVWFIPTLEVKSPSAPWTLKVNGGKITGINYQEVFDQQIERHLEQVREFQRTIAKLENVLRQQKAITKSCEKIANDRGNVIKQLTRAVIEQTDSSIKLKAALRVIIDDESLMHVLRRLYPQNSPVTTATRVFELSNSADTHHGRAKAYFDAAKAESETNGCEAIKAAQQEVRSERTNGARAPWDR
ncbi:hypothetical protein [Stenotrophomonas phage vB_SmaS_BUCT548]|uniref:Uncharacterized protein n=1 Tax=Stenotrophomonas phage vB_SmaS_BUCT548 TaxID=2712941 RepID=A0A7D2HJG5_9CAUD|nr:hypothetical protein PQD75_gp085 [Stenotrophomonas phage vB_SmaS_BUCT548]QIQ60787.1 hypothetical protein [Stenotrophomonas phage vB_SmaS_BUCT548]